MRLAICLLTAAVIGLGVWVWSLKSSAEEDAATMERIERHLERISEGLMRRLEKVEASISGHPILKPPR